MEDQDPKLEAERRSERKTYRRRNKSVMDASSIPRRDSSAIERNPHVSQRDREMGHPAVRFRIHIQKGGLRKRYSSGAPASEDLQGGGVFSVVVGFYVIEGDEEA
jgi:hypothetical protein